MDHLQTRLEALEQQMHTVNCRLRWWRGLACGLIGLALLTWALPAGTGEQQGLAQRVAALESLLIHFTRQGNEVFITGANVHLVNGQGATTTTNGLGNLIVGYNESRPGDNVDCGEGPVPLICTDMRTGSHNVVVGRRQNFSRFGGLVVGDFNMISGDFAAVSGGLFNTASGGAASVSGGIGHVASGGAASVSGGSQNTASGGAASVIGGRRNMAIGNGASVSGGQFNTAVGSSASVSGGSNNTASENLASVSGGQNNTASGFFASVSGGLNRTAPGENNWAAGDFFSDQ